MSRDTPYACPLRSYRGAARPEEQILQVILEESDLRIVFSARADHEFMRDSLVSYIAKLRGEITLWMTLYPEFRSSLLPLPLPDKAPALVTAMYAAAQAMHVGPFAAVAGAHCPGRSRAYASTAHKWRTSGRCHCGKRRRCFHNL